MIRVMLRLALVVLTIAIAAPAFAQTVTITSGEEVVTQYGADGCAFPANPDAPFRAIVNGGTVIGYLSHIRNKVMTGPDLDHMKVSCATALQGRESPDPAVHSDRDWIAAVWKLDNGKVGALVHDEYQPHRFPGRCRFTAYMQCWYNTITYAESDDGGLTFALKDKVAIAPGFRDDFEQGRHRGFFNPSNIVRHDGFNYTLVHTTGGGAQKSGVCVFRNDPKDDPWVWYGWTGRDFSYRPEDPYKTEPTGFCAPVGGLNSFVGSVVRTAAGTFIAIMVDYKSGEPRYATVLSRDLVTWSAPRILTDLPTMWSKNCEEPYRYGYGALLPDRAIDGGFDRIDSKGAVYFSRFRVENCKLGQRRELVRYRVEITP